MGYEPCLRCFGSADLHDYVPLGRRPVQGDAGLGTAVAHGDNLPLVKMLLKRGARADNC